MIQATGLTSTPRRNRPPVVDDLTFEAPPGRVTALFGGPGAGKTSALRLLLQLDRGHGAVFFRGRPLHRIRRPAREIGVLLEDVPGHPGRTARGHLRMLGAAVGVPAARADAVLDAVGLTELADERIGDLAAGMERRLGLATALLGDPHTLVLDAPTRGLSTRETVWMHGLLRQFAGKGGAVLVTDRDPESVTRLADQVLTLEGGRLIADQPVEEFARTRLRPRVAVLSPVAGRLAAVLEEEAGAAEPAVQPPCPPGAEAAAGSGAEGLSGTGVGEGPGPRAPRASVAGVSAEGPEPEAVAGGEAQVGASAAARDESAAGEPGARAAHGTASPGAAAADGAKAEGMAEGGPGGDTGSAARSAQSPAADAVPGAGPASAGGPAPAAAPASAVGAAPTAAPAPVGDPAPAAMSACAAASASAVGRDSVAVPAPAADAASADGPVPAPVADPAPTAMSACAAAPASAVGPDSVAVPAPAADAMPAAGPVPAATPGPATGPAPLAVPAPAADPAPAAMSAPAAAPGPAVGPDSVAVPAPPADPASAAEPVPAAGPAPVAVPASADGRVPAAVPASAPGPASVGGPAPATVPVPVPAAGGARGGRLSVVREDETCISVYGLSCAAVGETAYRHGIVVHRLVEETADLGPRAAGGDTAARGPRATPPRVLPRLPLPGPAWPLRYELRRATGVRTGWLIAVAALVASLVGSVLLARAGGAGELHRITGWPTDVPLPPVAIAAGLLGALSFGEEFRYPALAPARDTVPRRLGLLMAKFLVCAVGALLLCFAVLALDGAALLLLVGGDAVPLPGDWPLLMASVCALAVGSSWAGLMAAAVFRSTALGLATLLAVPILAVPIVQRAMAEPSVRSLVGLPHRLRAEALDQPHSMVDRLLALALRLASQPVGQALVLSLAVLLCAYALTGLRGRARQ
ncbi:ATP-binding cassette domain-containing protein [Streptomyces sparsogenes]|uniref:ATP-binding cassette domain-containing protein n=1 Tax=Streptomyces sparsogenes TaxID=67365 RepID=UPI003326B58D